MERSCDAMGGIARGTVPALGRQCDDLRAGINVPANCVERQGETGIETLRGERRSRVQRAGQVIGDARDSERILSHAYSAVAMRLA